MNLRFNLSPWKKNAAIVAAAVTVVAGVVAGRERPAVELIHERSKPAQDDGIDLAKLRPAEGSVPQNDPFARNFGPAEAGPSCCGAGGREAGRAAAAVPLFRPPHRERQDRGVRDARRGPARPRPRARRSASYRVDQIADAAISFTYLPLKMKQTSKLQDQRSPMKKILLTLAALALFGCAGTKL
jgi:hypothetical protein